MRLRYFRIRQRPPHTDTEVVFGREDLLGLKGSLHFLVGVNGTGKSRMLQSLVETLICLEKSKVPSFPVTLAYDLPHPETGELRTLLFRKPIHPNRLHFLEFPSAVAEDFPWNQLENEQGGFNADPVSPGTKDWLSDEPWLNMSIYLPKAVLVYTSGATGDWEKLFAPSALDQNLYTDLLREATSDVEMSRVSTSTAQTLLADDPFVMSVWVRNEDYRAALLATVLRQAAREFDAELSNPDQEVAFIEKRQSYRRNGRKLPERYDENFRTILDEIDWLWPISVSLTTTAQKDDTDWQKLAEVATDSQNSEASRTLHFDLRKRVENENTAARLLRALSDSSEGQEGNPFSALRRMLFWQRRGIFETKDIRITLKKLGSDDPIPLENLSDGERMFLGRMALMHLVGDTDNTLVILDEPETHFNDYWKREMVDIVDRTLEKQTSDVLLTTHSSIALTDAFSQEINRLFRSKRDPDLIKADHPRDPTFGATPTEVLQEIFEGPRAVGQRAAEFLDTLLVMLSYPDEVTSAFQNESIPSETLKQAMYDDLLPEEELGWPEDDKQRARTQLDKRLEATLRTIYDYGEARGYPIDQRLFNALDDLLPKIGAGYYRFEFSRRLKPRDSNQLNDNGHGAEG